MGGKRAGLEEECGENVEETAAGRSSSSLDYGRIRRSTGLNFFS